MNILLVNDDGIFAKGIHVLADALAQIEDVNLYIIAPDRQRSCCGHALTLFEEVKLEKQDPKEFNDKVRWVYSCSGVPADCARIGIFLLKEEGVELDLVCTGINHGSNWGTDIYYSGTLAAARESSVCFKQAIAFSLASAESIHFENFYDIVPEVIAKAYKKLPYTTVLNVNLPDLPKNEIKGIKICKQGPMDYGLGYKKTSESEKAFSLEFDGGEIFQNFDDPNWDVVLGKQGYITLVACDLMPFNYDSMKAIENLHIEFNG